MQHPQQPFGNLPRPQGYTTSQSQQYPIYAQQQQPPPQHQGWHLYAQQHHMQQQPWRGPPQHYGPAGGIAQSHAWQSQQHRQYPQPAALHEAHTQQQPQMYPHQSRDQYQQPGTRFDQPGMPQYAPQQQAPIYAQAGYAKPQPSFLAPPQPQQTPRPADTPSHAPIYHLQQQQLPPAQARTAPAGQVAMAAAEWSHYAQPRPAVAVDEGTRQLFAQTSRGTGAISGTDAFQLLSQSDLPRDELARIWDIADSGQRGSLSLEDFSVALRLIALVQRTGKLAGSREELAEHEAKTPFMMPAFAVNKLTKPSAATVQLAVAEAPATTVSERSPMAPTTMGLPGVEEDVFGEFADGGEHKEVAGATEDDGFGEFAAGTPDPTAAETSGSIDFGEPESVPAFEIKAPAIEAIPPVTEEAEAGAAIAVSSGAVAAEGGNAASLLDDMLGAALCGESIAPKKPSARTAPTTVAPAPASKDPGGPVFVDNSALNSKLSVFDAMAEVDVAAATEEWDDFADATSLPVKPTGEGMDGQSPAFATGSDITTDSSGLAIAAQGASGVPLAAANDDFGDFDASPAPADEFGDFASEGIVDCAASGAPDGSSSMSTFNDVSIGPMRVARPEGGSKFGDFEPTVDGCKKNGAVASRGDDFVASIMYDNRSVGIGAPEGDEFGTYVGVEQPTGNSGFARFGGVAKEGTRASADNFDEFVGPVSTDDAFANFDGGAPRKATAASDDFGDFESPEAEDETQDGFANFDGSKMGGIASKNENDDFGAFGSPEPAESSIGIEVTAAEDDDFGDFNSPVTAHAGVSNLNGFGKGETLAESEDFGNFDSAVPTHGGFANFDGGAEEQSPETDEEFGDFENTTARTKERGPRTEADQGFGDFETLAAFGDFAKDSSLSNAVDDRITDFEVPSTNATVKKVFGQLSAPSAAAPLPTARATLTDEEVGAALIKKRWYADGAAWLVAGRHRRELKTSREEMEAAAKALRFEEAIQLRGKIERLEAACHEDDVNAESRLRKAQGGGEALLISAAHASIREIDSAAASRLETDLSRRLGGSDFDALLADMSDPAEAAEAQRAAFEAVFATAYARHALGGAHNRPPDAWKAIVVKAYSLLDDSLPALREIADSLAEIDSELDRNRAKRLADHVVALQTAADVGQSVLEAAARAAYEEPPGGNDVRDAFESACRQLESLAGKLLPPGMHRPADQAVKSAQFDPPRTVEELRILPPNTCALTLKVLDDQLLSYEGTPFFAPAINFWLNLVSTTPPARFRQQAEVA